jgi:FkbM family methyltransferase
VRHFFDDRREGVFLDVRCFHWFEYSVTAYLEKQLGWSGVAIDALPQLANGWKKHRPRSSFFSYAITDHSGDELSFYAAGPLSSLDEGHTKQWKNIQEKVKPQEITVATITLNDLLEREGIEKIDFMNMDIEGAEPAALAGFDIKKYRPELVCIEVARKNRESVIEYFRANDYERIDAYDEQDDVNWYFRPRS